MLRAVSIDTTDCSASLCNSHISALSVPAGATTKAIDGRLSIKISCTADNIMRHSAACRAPRSACACASLLPCSLCAAVKPWSCKTWMQWRASPCFWSKLTTAIAAGRETATLSTPGASCSRLRTRPTHPPHFMPPTSSRTDTVSTTVLLSFSLPPRSERVPCACRFISGMSIRRKSGKLCGWWSLLCSEGSRVDGAVQSA
mmetsp:Transcript_8087/g.12827  ORF Transcript_8087/g.12827 Transcript_8087/m.12827 type:complete len:201 (+) Transcript_8087:1469-2071(+)